jgi:4-hydroxyacetophenone monooxygenase
MVANRATTSVTAQLRTASDEDIRRGVDTADPVVLRTLLVQYGGRSDLAALPRATFNAGGSDRAAPQPFASDSDVEVIRSAAVEMLSELRKAGRNDIAPPSSDAFHELLELTFGHDVDPGLVDYWMEEFGIAEVPRASPPVKPSGRWANAPFTVAIIGSGMSGISAAVHLKQAGIPFTVIERNVGVGGTWFENHYPGTRVDVDSRAYSYTFEPDYEWTHHFTLQPGLLQYFNDVVDKHGFRKEILFEREVTSATWDDHTASWTLELRGPVGPETLTANAVITGVGLFNRPIKPNIDGLDDYQGEVLHTARWDDAFDPTGKRIAVIDEHNPYFILVRVILLSRYWSN